LALVRSYHEIVKKLQAERKAMFRHRMFVWVDCYKYRGHGVILLSDDPPPHVVAVLLENGNTWWYPIETVVPVTDLRKVPRSVRRLKLRWHGYKLAGVA
jgi:hypothetical protein